MVEAEPRKRQESEKSASEVDLRAIFRAPTSSAADLSDINNNPWNFRNWWNTIQAQDSGDYIVLLPASLNKP